ncbi:MAG TPA: hypothetical protein VG757_08160 [Devosia sp.]|nr:hypothetical protein [Devosia sp.]
MTDWPLLLAMAGTALVTLTLALYTGAAVRAAKRRTEELTRAERSLAAHYKALEAILDCDDVSDRMKGAVFNFHYAVVNKDLAFELAPTLLTDAKEPSDEFEQDYRALQAKNGKVFSALHEVVQTGIVSMMLRWPETAKHFRRATMAAAVFNDEQELRIAKKMVHRGAAARGDHHDNTGGMGMGGLIAAQ